MSCIPINVKEASLEELLGLSAPDCAAFFEECHRWKTETPRRRLQRMALHCHPMNIFCILLKECLHLGQAASRFGTWRSPVAHLLGVQGVAGSNPAVPTKKWSRVLPHETGRFREGSLRENPAVPTGNCELVITDWMRGEASRLPAVIYLLAGRSDKEVVAPARRRSPTGQAGGSP